MKNKFTQNESLRRLANKKVILGVSAILVSIVFIAITSFIPFIISGEKLGSEKFWTDELIIIAITILGLVAMVFVGQASNAQDPKSKIAKAKVNFQDSISKISNSNHFSQWVKKVLQPKDIQSAKEREMRKIGIDDYTVLNLTDFEIENLAKSAQKYNGRYYSKLDEKKVEKLLELKDGIKHVRLVEPEYYLTVSSIEIDKTDSEKSGRESRKKNAKLLFSVASKILITLIPSMIFAALVRDVTGGDVSTPEAWATFCLRMVNMLTSVFFGYIVGCQMNDIDADYIELRCRVHSKFLQDSEFKPLSQQELAKKEYIEEVKRQNEEYAKSLELKDLDEMRLQLPDRSE